MDLLSQVKERLSIFTNLYDTIRIVDPINKETSVLEGNLVIETSHTCYSKWRKNTFCKNCISMRAYQNNDTFVKIEYDEGKIILVTATPIEIDGSRYVLEILKDITTNGSALHKIKGDSCFTEELLSTMNEKVIKDELTDVYNRRYINERLAYDINYAYIAKHPLSVIMIDIDHFKDINDTYGHVIGDKILIHFIKIISNSIRSTTDWIGRYGGEEFLIVLNNTGLNNAYIVAEKIRKIVETTSFQYGDHNINITASLGVCSVEDTKIDIETLLTNVDKKLYNAKISGRNRSCK